jgi:cation/acetate symporter
LDGDGSIGVGDLLVARDGIALALPTLASLPYILTAVMAAAGLAIALAASGSHLFTLGASLAEDLYGSLDPQPIILPRLLLAWGVIGVVALIMAAYLLVADVDALSYAVTAFALAAATFFPAVFLSTWWKRCSAWGVIASLSIGFGLMLLSLMAGGLVGIADTAAGIAGSSLVSALLAVLAGIGVSLYGPAAKSADKDFFEAIRRPDGETLYDKAEAQASAAQRKAE